MMQSNENGGLVELCLAYHLYLKPVAKVSITVQVPILKQQNQNKAISNWEVIEKLRQLSRPIVFDQLKVVKTTFEFVRFVADLENKTDVKRVITSLDGKMIKLSGFPDNLRVRASEAKLDYPTRHHWDAFFRDAPSMDERRAGERPDTIHLRGLPTRWFVDWAAAINSGQEDATMAARQDDTVSMEPSEHVLRTVFQAYGDVRCVDIPMLDPCQMGSRNTVSTIRGGTGTAMGLTFEAYVQYREYMGFVRAMDAFRGMKLVHAPPAESLAGGQQQGAGGSKIFTAEIKVDFDRDRHLSDVSIRRRQAERERMEAVERQRIEAEEMERQRREQEALELEKLRLEESEAKERRRKAREERRRAKAEEKRRREREAAVQRKIAMEERKILIAKRKLESIRLLSELIRRVKVKEERAIRLRREKEFEEEELKKTSAEQQLAAERQRRKLGHEHRKRERLRLQEQELRDKILKKLGQLGDRREAKERRRLRKILSKHQSVSSQQR